MNTQPGKPDTRGSLFVFFADLFTRHSIRGLLVGGYAVIAYKIQRTTFDIDFMITPEDCAKLEPDLCAAGYSVFNRRDAFVQFRSEKSDMRDVDFLLGDQKTVDTLYRDGTTVTIAGRPFTVPSIKHLIAMKLHSVADNTKRELKDFPDIVHLLEAGALDPRDPDIAALFAAYHAEDIYKRVLGIMKGRT